MSFSNNISVLEALRVLYDASDESLRSHGTKLKAIVERLQPLIEDHGTTISAARCRADGHINNASSFSLDSETSLAHSPDQRIPPQTHSNLYRLSPTAPSPIENFVSSLHNKLENIKKLLSLVCHTSIKDEPMWSQDDPQISGNHERSPLLKLRRGLSQRSLASEFDNWEKSTYGVSKVIERTTELSVKPRNRKLGHIAEFLRINKHRFYNQSAVRKGIEHGIKLLVCERLLRERGVSAILVFCYHELRSIKFQELDGLKAAIENADAIKKLAEQQTNWLDQRQRDYDAWYNSIPRPSKSLAIKRRPLSPPTLSKRIKTQNSHDSKQHVSSLTVRPGVKIPEKALASFSNVTPVPPVEQTSAASRIHLTSPPYFNCSNSSIGCGGKGMTIDSTAHRASVDASELSGSNPPQWVDQWTEPFNSQNQAVMQNTPGKSSLMTPHQGQMVNTFFDPSSYIQKENPFSVTRDQVINTFFDPSSYTQVITSIDDPYQEQMPARSFNSSDFIQKENPSFSSHEHIKNTSFDPSSYIQENSSVDTLRQEEMTRFFNPSSYIQENPFVTLCLGQAVATSCDLPSFTQQASLSFDAHQEQIGESSSNPSNWIQ